MIYFVATWFRLIRGRTAVRQTWPFARSVTSAGLKVTMVAVTIFAAFLIPIMTTNDANAQPAYRDRVGLAFRTWIEELWPEAKRAGVSRATFDEAFRGIWLDWKLPDLVPPAIASFRPSPKERGFQKKKKRQPEFDLPGNYFPENRISTLVQTVRKKFAEWQDLLTVLESRYGVGKAVILAVWARETAFGTYRIPHYAIQALATQGFMGRRKIFFPQTARYRIANLARGSCDPQRNEEFLGRRHGAYPVFAIGFSKFCGGFRWRWTAGYLAVNS